MGKLEGKTKAELEGMLHNLDIQLACVHDLGTSPKHRELYEKLQRKALEIKEVLHTETPVDTDFRKGKKK